MFGAIEYKTSEVKKLFVKLKAEFNFSDRYSQL